MKKKITALLMVLTLLGGILNGCGNEQNSNNNDSGALVGQNDENTKEDTELLTLTVGVPTGYVTDGFEAVAKVAEEKLGIAFEIQPYSDAADSTAFKSLLASGETPDIVFYNSGSLLESINPKEYFLNLSSYEMLDKLDETFKDSVTIDGAVYGMPIGSSMGGGVLYNKSMYEEYGLTVPKTWDEFLANCEALKEADETAVIGSFGTSWTSQIVFLADYYNVVAEEPDFSKNFEAGTAKYAETEIAVKSFEKYSDLMPYYNEDNVVATYDDGCAMLAEGDGYHYFQLSQSLGNIYNLYDKETVDNIGFFAVPGESADSNGMTIWPSNAIYVNKDSENIEDIIRFLEYYITDEALDIYDEALPSYGPYHVMGYEPRGDAYAAVANDMQPYFDSGSIALAQEYETAVKGANCESICVEVASGQLDGKAAAEKYDNDCYKQALQLGLDWER